MPRPAALLAALLLMPAGCAGSSAPMPSAPSGRTLFARDCSACHSLSGHSSPRQQGGDLRGVHLGRSTLTQFTAEMPVRHRLSAAELSAVVAYVAAVQQRGR